MNDRETRLLDSFHVDVLDPRASHLKLRCRKCGATWRPRRQTHGDRETSYWLCWRGCNAPSERPLTE
jgi:hypothetical protein